MSGGAVAVQPRSEAARTQDEAAMKCGERKFAAPGSLLPLRAPRTDYFLMHEAAICVCRRERRSCRCTRLLTE